jgi:nitroreductase
MKGSGCMSVYETIQKRRTIRRFKQATIPYEMILKIVDAARVAPSASNLQPLEYIIVNEPSKVQELFQHTGWAGYLPRDIGRPPDDKKPVAFIVVLYNTSIKTNWLGHDIGASTENMILTALEAGIGACWIGSIEREKIRHLFNIPENYEINCVLALGFPDEEPVAEPLSDSVKYFRDETGRLHVPKRRLQDMLHHNNF